MCVSLMFIIRKTDSKIIFNKFVKTFIHFLAAEIVLMVCFEKLMVSNEK